MIQENTIITDGSCKFVVRNIGGGGVLKKGFVVPFVGTFKNGYPVDEYTGLVDTDWHICDGTNGTFDLRDRFIVGAGNSYSQGNTGGEKKHKLTVNELPERTVVSFTNKGTDKVSYASIRTWTNSNESYINPSGWGDSNIYDAKANVSPPLITGDTETPHNNMPPYLALTFIQKIK